MLVCTLITAKRKKLNMEGGSGQLSVTKCWLNSNITKEGHILKFRRFWLVLPIIVALLLTTACTPTAGPEAGEKILTIASQYTIATLNPFKTSSDGDGYIIRQVMEPLVSGITGNLKPLLAESWENIDDLTWEFKLRENAYWHEGNEVYAEGANEQVKAVDVKASFDYVIDPANKAQYQARLAQVIKQVEVIDEFTVRLITNEPSAWFLTDVHRVPIFSLKALEVLGEDVFDFTPIGTGPFKFVEYVPDDRVVLEKNDKYFIEPNLDQVIFRIIPDQAVAAIALKTGEIDMALQIPTTEVESVKSTAGLKVIPTSVGGAYRYVAFNCDSELFNDKQVRNAIAYAIDMDAAVDAIFDGDPLMGRRAYMSVVSGVPGYADASDLWEYNVDKAKALLDELGWKPGKDGILEKNGKKFSFTLKTPSDAARSKLGIIIATDLKNIGIDCKPQASEFATLVDDMNRSNFEMGISGGYGGEDGLFMMFHSTEGGGPRINYANPQVDELLGKAKVTVELEEREPLLIEAARLIAADRPHLPAYYEFWQLGYNEKVKGFGDPPSVYIPLTSPYRNVDIEN